MKALRGQQTVKIGVFGGTFDPIHSGHMAVARAAVRRFRLDRIYFVPSGTPPHKSHHRLTAFLHRYTMVALACAREPRFAPSLLEAGPDLAGRARRYSVDTVRRLRRRWPRARLFFILGADQFLTLPTWKNYRTLIKLCDFIVATRPGFRVSATRAARIVPKLREADRVHWLTAVHADVSATAIRRRARRGASLRGWVPPLVEDYIRSAGLYRRS
ncbi:MAG: nicotinate-nucleotide adenylyltransferase [Terriglobia bacterium]